MRQDIIYFGHDKINQESDYERLEEQEYIQNLLNIIYQMPKIDKYICLLHFGIGYQRAYTQKEIGEILGLSQSRISRKLAKIIMFLRRELCPSDGRAYLKRQEQAQHYKKLSLHKSLYK